MTLLDVPAAAPAKKKRWEKARWPNEPIAALLAARGISEGDLRTHYDPPIHWKEDRELLTLTLVDEICCRVLHLHPINIYGMAWEADVPEQEELDLWAS